MATHNSNAETASRLSQKVKELIASGSLDYNSWRSLILEVESASSDDIDSISLSYDSFLSKFPLCHWHLEKYAQWKAKICGTQEAIEIYERGAGVAMFSVGFWVDYFTFGMSCFRDPEDLRRLFGRAFSYIGNDYFCHALWDKYMKYEFNQQGWSFLAQAYIQALRFPTKKLNFYHNNFKQFVANLEEEMEYEKDDDIGLEKLSDPFPAVKISRDEIFLVIKDLLVSSDKFLKYKALDRYRSIGEEFYQKSCKLNEKIQYFETNIRRRYFCVTPLDDDQLKNWHLYLDFIEKQDNLDWAVKLYERCLISCANYPEFWMRYVHFLESKRGRELAISALDRATKIFLKNVPDIHLFSARFKEHIGDLNGARASLLQCDTKNDSIFFEKVVAQASIEQRLGNLMKASSMYEEALKTAKEKQKSRILPRLYCHYARFTFMTTGSADAARNVLINGVKQVPNCRFLFEELIKFAMTHEGSSQVNVVDSIISDAIYPGSDEYCGLDAKDRESISCLFLEFVNLYGTAQDVIKAWNRHNYLFPQFLRRDSIYKHFASGRCLLNIGQLQVEQDSVNREIDLTQVKEKLPPQNDYDNNGKQTAVPLCTKDIILSDKDVSQGNENGLSWQSREDKPGAMDDTMYLAKSKGNVSNSHDSVPDSSYHSRGDKPDLMVVSAEIINQSAEHSSSMDEPANELDKLSEITKPVELLSPFNHEFRQQKQPISLDSTTFNYKETENQDSIPMSCDVCEGSVSPNSSPIVESPLLHNASERDGSTSNQNSSMKNIPAEKKEPSETGETVKTDGKVAAPGYTSSKFHEQANEQEHDYHPANELDSKMLMEQGNVESNSGMQNCSQSMAAIQENTKTDHAWPVNRNPSMTTSTAQSPLLSSPLVSYPQQNAQQSNLPSSQDPWQAQQAFAMNQMLQYHYHQQHLVQQQHYQQQMQLPLFQLQDHYMNQQQYQQPNHQNLQPLPQQYYGQDQQHQLQQQMTYFGQFHQQLQQQHYYQQNQQLQHDQHPHQLQELAYHVNQQGYQQHAATQGQQIPLLQYQQHQLSYQHLQQQQSHGGHLHIQEHLHQQDEQLQKQEDVSSGHNISKKQKDSKNAHQISDGSESSKSSHLQG